jgi:uncharacterized protein (TIGR02266 family)
MADTRRDKRAPIALKVRYKSATVDEFLEHYSEDISRGGTFIKSKKPMAVGTLLKFELQLKDESRLIHGVGRVVWKREPDEATDGNPAGMGIKFIKMDSESRALVQKILDVRGDSPGKFDSGAHPPGSNGAAAVSDAFFPSTTPEDEMPPPEDRTAIRDASEFLGEALGDTDGAGQEARANAEEARRRTEELERERAQAAQAAVEAEAKADAKSEAAQLGVADTVLAQPAGSPAAAPDPATDDNISDAAETLPRRPMSQPEEDEERDEPAPAAAAPARVAEQAPARREPKSRALPMVVGLVAVGLVAYLVLSNAGMLGGGDEVPELAAAPDEDPSADEALAAQEDPEAAAEDPEPPAEPEPEVARVAVPVKAKGAAGTPVAFLVDGKPVGEGIEELQLPVGVEVTVRAIAPGLTAEPKTVTAAEANNKPLVFEMAPLAYMVMAETDPPGTRVKAGGGTVTTPGRVRLRRVDDPVVVTAARPGFQPVRQELPLSAFKLDEEAGEMQASIQLTLEPMKVAAPAAPRPAAPKEKDDSAAEGDKPAAPPAEAAPAPKAEAAPPADKPKAEPAPAPAPKPPAAPDEG